MDPTQVPKLIDCRALERSGVVANCRMNRERELVGSNGYEKELGLNPVAWLRNRLERTEPARWLDLCCGSGTALIQAATQFTTSGDSDRIQIVGVDLVGMFARLDDPIPCLQLIEASLNDWNSDSPFDLITCVHGLHYIGDKLGLISRAASWLTKDGCLIANLGLENIKLDGMDRRSSDVRDEFRRQSLEYNARTRRLRCAGHRVLRWPYRYLGADDTAGPNYTGQSAVHSHYQQLRMT